MSRTGAHVSSRLSDQPEGEMPSWPLIEID